ncbi:tail fiber protein [Galbibacter sp. EGI 63066]|uniref:tail fiber protein n=1 Tax=Galbibacter sp. EGI 63066 TaxID=2993559 RepID=UPI00224994F6|nr:tail fiber protein [Galbibacter sp. EGI 63066]MCX2680350.1 tail fiber protein [Galbibacter sp. EGI 63066]
MIAHLHVKDIFIFLFITIIYTGAYAQKQYPENLSPDQIDIGLYYQWGPGANNSGYGWSYPYGTKLTLNGSAYRNFELLVTHYPYGKLKLRQWSPDNQWTTWRNIPIADENGNIGLGIDNPEARLDIYSEMRISSRNERDNTYLRINRGSSGRDRAVVSFGQGNQYKWHVGLLYRGGAANSDFFISQQSEIRDGNGNYVHTPDFTIKQNGNIGIGTENPDARLTVVGDVHAQEVKVDLNGAVAPDYVFKEDYELKTLEEVKRFIQSEGHLPNIPSANEMEEEGINLKAMNLKLLEKIEELTLYAIEQHKTNDQQSKFIKTLLSRLEKLEKQNIELSEQIESIKKKIK